jgi:hypothetical protein
LLDFWLGFFCVLSSCRCALETAGPGFDPLGLYEEGSDSPSRSPLSTFFGILAPVFGSSSGGGARREKASYGRGAAGCQFRAISFTFIRTNASLGTIFMGYAIMLCYRTNYLGLVVCFISLYTSTPLSQNN